jgi:hypothetical protein
VRVRYASLAVLLSGLLLILTACDDDHNCSCPCDPGPPSCRTGITIAQGVSGHVWFWQGDFERIPPTGHLSPVYREILVYELTDLDHVASLAPAFYSEIHTQRVAETRTDACGFFEVALPSGRYSLFVQEGDLYYANTFDSLGNIQTVTVDSATVSQQRIDITYEARF